MTNASLSNPLRQKQLLKLFFFLSLLLSSVLLILKVENMLLSCLLAFVGSYLMEPIVNSFERTGLRRTYAITLTFVVVTIALGVLLTLSRSFLFQQVISLKSEFPQYIAGTRNFIDNFSTQFELFDGIISPQEFTHHIEVTLFKWTSSIFEDLPKFLSQSLMTLFLAPFLTFFLLLDGKKLSRLLLTLVPNNYFELSLNLYSQINSQMGQFVRARLLEAALVGIIVGIGLKTFNFPYPFLLAFFALLTNLIPYLGPIIGFIPAIVIALAGQDPTYLLIVSCSIYAFAQVIDIVFIIPFVVAKIVDLHPVTVVIAILIGAQTMGIIGMLISIPMASVIKVTITNLYRHLIEFRP